MRIMVLSPYLPHRQVGHGGGTAIRGLLRYLSRQHQVTLVSLVRPGEMERVPEAAALGVKVVPVPFVDRQARGAARWTLAGTRLQAWIRSWRSRYPFYVEKYWSRRLSQQVIAAAAVHRPDAIQIEYLQLSLLCRDLRRWRDGLPSRSDRPAGEGPPSAPRLILNTHEVGSVPRRRRAQLARNRLARMHFQAAASAWERLQRHAATWADTTLCVTEQERELLAAQGCPRVRTVPLGMDLEAFECDWQPVPPERILFVGSFAHRPNRVAVKFLVDKVWPRVAQYTPTGQIVLAGRGSGAFLRALGQRDKRIVALGFVEDLTKLFRECCLFVAPLAEGGGIKIKILEAMARGIPVVTTPIGAEGIVNSAEDALLIAQPDATFAESMIQALQAPEATRRRAAKARRIIEERFSWSAITEKLTSIYEGR
jgi:glycosyltransferase involved in cell wall biosynthesis